MIEMGARIYVPQLGRFLQPDPVYGGSCSAYDYSCADPLNLYDLDGRMPTGPGDKPIKKAKYMKPGIKPRKSKQRHPVRRVIERQYKTNEPAITRGGRKRRVRGRLLIKATRGVMVIKPARCAVSIIGITNDSDACDPFEMLDIEEAN